MSEHLPINEEAPGWGAERFDNPEDQALMDHHLPDVSAGINPADVHHMGYCLSRGAMLRSLDRWIAAGPCANDVQEEVDGTIKALRSLLELSGGSNV